MAILQGLCLVSCTASSEGDGPLLTPKGLDKVPEIPLLPLLLALTSMHVSKCCCWTNYALNEKKSWSDSTEVRHGISSLALAASVGSIVPFLQHLSLVPNRVSVTTSNAQHLSTGGAASAL